MLLLMLWILPMNLLVVLTWVRNISLRWLTPFSITRNLLCIVPLIVMVELLSAGQMVPRVTGQ